MHYCTSFKEQDKIEHFRCCLRLRKKFSRIYFAVIWFILFLVAIAFFLLSPTTKWFSKEFSMLNADLSIDDNGKSSCSGNVTLNNSSYSTDLTMELIQVDTGKVMKTWTDSGSISISLTNKPWYVTSGHRYQVKVTVTVYNTSGKSIETSEEVSSIVKF